MLTVKPSVLDYIKIVLCATLLALAYVLFVIPNDFAPAGLNGIATMVQYKLHFSIGYFSLIINVPLCILAYFLINKEFAVKSLVFCLTYSLTYLLFQNLEFLQAFVYDANGVDTIFPCMIAGLTGGLVYGVCFRSNASTGGTDIVAKYINKKKPLLDFFWVTFIINAVVAFASLFVYSETGTNGALEYNYKPICLCILYCFMSSFMGKHILQGYQSAFKFFVVTKYAKEISEEILTVLRHSATKIHGTGIYSEEDKEVLLCVVNKHQIIDFKNILKKYPNTFAFIETVNETVGNFKKIK